MRRWFRPMLAAMLLTTLLAGARAAMALSGPAVRDDAEIFSRDTDDQLTQIVKTIHDRFGKDLTIRTFAEIPDEQKSELAAQGKEKFYENWLRTEARKAQTNGIFVLVVKQPGRLQIGVGTLTRKKAFTNDDRDEMRDLMLKSFREKKFDDGMLAGANFVLQRLEKNLGAGSTPSTGSAERPTPAASAPATSPTTQPATEPTPATAPATEPATQKANVPGDFEPKN